MRGKGARRDGARAAQFVLNWNSSVERGPNAEFETGPQVSAKLVRRHFNRPEFLCELESARARNSSSGRADAIESEWSAIDSVRQESRLS
jgi:hypothetical protein